MTGTRLLALALALCLAAATGRATSLAQDNGRQLSGLTVANGEAPLPIVGPGAPNFSPEQTASFLCSQQNGGVAVLGAAFTGARVTSPVAGRTETGAPPDPFTAASPVEVIRKAHEATLRAREVRTRAFNGDATREELEQSELQRQEAVRPLTNMGLAERFPGPSLRGLQIENVERQRALENGRAVLLITGVIRNTTRQMIVLPPLSVEAVDVRGFVLAGQTSPLDRETIGPGESQIFVFRFKNPPRYTAEVRPHFAPPFGQRNFRGCDFFDPRVFDPNEARLQTVRAATTPVPVPNVGRGAPNYTPDELAAMARHARTEAEMAYDGVLTPASRAASSTCGSSPSWRSLMITADLMEEAWIATTAADEVRRDAARGVFLPGEVEAAELTRQAAVGAFTLARPVAGQDARIPQPDLSISSPAIRTQSGTGGTFVVVSGQVRNTGARPAPAPALLISVADRHGFILNQVVSGSVGEVGPGQTVNYTQTVSVPTVLVDRARVEFTCLPPRGRTEAVMRGLMEELLRGTSDQVATGPASTVAPGFNLTEMKAAVARFGPLKSLVFVETDIEGRDLYRASFQRGDATFLLTVGPLGRVRGLSMKPVS